VRALYDAIAAYLAEREPWPGIATAFAAAAPAAVQPGAPIALALAALEAGPSTAAVVDAVHAVAPALRWQQNPTYREPAFLRCYAYCELLGPAGIAVHPALSAGLLYLAPETDYPPHAHPAEEAYHLIAGRSAWQLGDAPPCWREPGARMLHPSGVAHAMRSGASPLLALYLWRGEITEPARFVAGACGTADDAQQGGDPLG
jgi:hypothetical protein